MLEIGLYFIFLILCPQLPLSAAHKAPIVRLTARVDLGAAGTPANCLGQQGNVNALFTLKKSKIKPVAYFFFIKKF